MNKTNRNYTSTPKLFIASLFCILLVCIACTKLDSPSENEDGVNSKEDGGSTGKDSSPPTFAFLPPNDASSENINSATDSSSERDGESTIPDGGHGDGEIVDGRADTSETQRGCDEEGALQCVANASSARQICKDGIWQNTDSCKDDEICDTSNTESPGTCLSAMSLCEGSANEFICVNGVMHECNVDGISISQQSCESQLHCQTGLPQLKCAVCIPGLDHKCEQQELLQCDSTGMDYIHDETCSTEAPCNAEAGACTNLYCFPNTYRCSGGVLYKCNADGSAEEDQLVCDSGICDQTNAQCDVCVAGQDKTCIDNKPAVCNSEGQDWNIDSCGVNYPYCVGQGVCKKCGTDAHCEPRDCMLATCTDTGCQYINDSAAFGKACNGGQGYCNATGQCLECLQGYHCTSPTTPVCSNGVCIACNASGGCSTGVCKTSTLDPTKNKCVACLDPSRDCPSGWTCNLGTNECEAPSGPVCGDGNLEGDEQCDDGDTTGPKISSSGVISNYDGCGPNCQIHWTWGCPLKHKSLNDLATYCKRELVDNNPSVATWVWTLPSDGSQTGVDGLSIGELSTCAGPCHPVRRSDGSNFGYCDNASGNAVAHTIPGSGGYQVTCMNGACVIPCRGTSKSCPPGYKCADANHKVLLMQEWVDSDGTDIQYGHYDYCVAQEFGTPPFDYAD